MHETFGTELLNGAIKAAKMKGYDYFDLANKFGDHYMRDEAFMKNVYK